MLDDPQYKKVCPCQHCQQARQKGLDVDTHRYDEVHQEDKNWSFKVFCRCKRCREIRQRLALREIRG